MRQEKETGQTAGSRRARGDSGELQIVENRKRVEEKVFICGDPAEETSERQSTERQQSTDVAVTQCSAHFLSVLFYRYGREAQRC